MDKNKIQKLAENYFLKMVEIRRHLHVNPELSFQEFNTANYIASVLDGLDIKYKKGVAGTGIVAEIIGGKSDGRVLALRADMDALPIQELNQIDYCSVVPGVMHACGHDVHTSILLGALMILNELKSELKCTLRVLFQPGEEKLPGGASLMIKEGVLQNPSPKAIIGEHVFPELETGKVGFRSGMYMASTDEMYLQVIGKGGHAALPHQYNNPILAASKILLKLQEEFMTNSNKIVPEHIPTVLAFGKLNAEGATNIIPDEVKIEGTFRTMNEDWRAKAHLLIQNLVEKIATEYQVKAILTISKGYPFLVNEEKITNYWRSKAIEFLGEENVVELEPRMTAEDFAWYSQEIPACFYRLGTGNKKRGITASVHTANFDVDEDSLRIGAGLMAFAALQY